MYDRRGRLPNYVVRHYLEFIKALHFMLAALEGFQALSYRPVARNPIICLPIQQRGCGAVRACGLRLYIFEFAVACFLLSTTVLRLKNS